MWDLSSVKFSVEPLMKYSAKFAWKRWNWKNSFLQKRSVGLSTGHVRRTSIFMVHCRAKCALQICIYRLKTDAFFYDKIVFQTKVSFFVQLLWANTWSYQAEISLVVRQLQDVLARKISALSHRSMTRQKHRQFVKKLLFPANVESIKSQGFN